MCATKAKNSLELSEYLATVLEIWYLIEQDQSNVIQSKLKHFFHFRVIITWQLTEWVIPTLIVTTWK